MMRPHACVSLTTSGLDAVDGTRDFILLIEP